MKKILLIFLIIISFSACTWIDEPTIEITNSDTEQNETDEEILRTRSGDANENNPYSLKNIQTAYNQIRLAQGLDSISLEPSHYYVRFLPADTLQYYIIHDSLFLELFDYPLDRILTNAEVEFYENDLIDDYPWFYTVVPTDFDFPTELQYEVLDEVYIQCEETDVPVSPGTKTPILDGTIVDIGDQATKGKTVITNVPRRGMQQEWPQPQIEDQALWEQIVNLAFINTGNQSAMSQFSAWYPSATISYTDDMTGTVRPLEGVKVRVTNFLNSGSGYTGADGNVSGITGWAGRFRNGVRYQIIFENDGLAGWKWNIRDGRTGQAKIKADDNDIEGRWIYTIGNSSTNKDREESAYAHVHVATWEFYMKQNEITKCTAITPMNIAVKWDDYNPDESGHFARWVRWISNGMFNWGNPIVVWGKDDASTFSSRQWILNTQVHELGHSSHWQAVINTPGVNRHSHYIDLTKKMKESYANAIAVFLMRSIWPNHWGSIPRGYDETYTGIGEALFNQGFTMKQLQNTITTADNWNQWRDKLKALNVTDGVVVDLLFARPVPLWDFNFRDCISGPRIIYPNTTHTYELPQNITTTARGITINNWTIEGPAVETGTRPANNRTITIRSTDVGNIILRATLDFPTGVQYIVSCPIKSASSAVISGASSGFSGIPLTYNLDDYAGTSNVSWSITPTMDTRLHNYQNIVLSNLQNRVMFYKSGTYTISAFAGAEKLATKTVSITSSSLLRYWPYENTGYPYDVWISGSLLGKTIISPHDGITRNIIRAEWSSPVNTTFWIVMPNPMQFYAFSTKSTGHPYYSKMIAVNEYTYYNNTRYYNTTANGWSLCTPKFYILNEQVAGTVPLYRIEEGEYRNESRYSQDSYLTLENLHSYETVTGWITFLGIKIRKNSWKFRNNKGIIGYVYPVPNSETITL